VDAGALSKEILFRPLLITTAAPAITPMQPVLLPVPVTADFTIGEEEDINAA